jgi:CBS-domain-containing membrane protein
MTFSQAIFAEGTQVTLPPSGTVVLVMIFLAIFAFVRGRTFVAIAVFLAALVIAGASSLLNQLTDANHPPTTNYPVTAQHDQRVASRPLFDHRDPGGRDPGGRDPGGRDPG